MHVRGYEELYDVVSVPLNLAPLPSPQSGLRCRHYAPPQHVTAALAHVVSIHPVMTCRGGLDASKRRTPRRPCLIADLDDSGDIQFKVRKNDEDVDRYAETFDEVHEIEVAEERAKTRKSMRAYEKMLGVPKAAAADARNRKRQREREARDQHHQRKQKRRCEVNSTSVGGCTNSRQKRHEPRLAFSPALTGSRKQHVSMSEAQFSAKRSTGRAQGGSSMQISWTRPCTSSSATGS